MRLLRILAFAAVTFSPCLAPVDAHATAWPERGPSTDTARSLIQPAAVKCGMFDGRFSCRTTNEIVPPRGKNVIPGTTRQPSPAPEAVPTDPGALQAPPPAAATTTPTGCPGGMAGTPPNCQCPRGTEQLGGHCIPYTESCRTGLAADANPPPCQSVEEKQVCTVRADGLRDCCCRTYSKF